MKKGFESILDLCLGRVLGGENPEDCLRDYPEYAAELKPLLYCAVTAKQASSVQPRPEFRAKAKAQFLAAAREAGEKKHRGFFAWRPAWAAIASGALVFVLASSATLVAADNSMPDEPLYAVKTLTEKARLKIASTEVARAELNAELADRRVAEIIYLANKGKSEEIETVSERLNGNLEKVVKLSGGKKPVAVMATAPKTAAKPPAALAVPAAPAPAPRAVPKPEVTPPPSRVQDNMTAGAALAPSPAKKASPPATPKPTTVEKTKTTDKQKIDKEKLKQAIARYAQKHPDQLREAIKNAPDSVKPALRRALAISEKGYREATESLEDDD